MFDIPCSGRAVVLVVSAVLGRHVWAAWGGQTRLPPALLFAGDLQACWFWLESDVACSRCSFSISSPHGATVLPGAGCGTDSCAASPYRRRHAWQLAILTWVGDCTGISRRRSPAASVPWHAKSKFHDRAGHVAQVTVVRAPPTQRSAFGLHPRREGDGAGTPSSRASVECGLPAPVRGISWHAR